MKKLIAVCLCVIFMMSLLTGCTQYNSKEKSNEDANITSSTKSEVSEQDISSEVCDECSSEAESSKNNKNNAMKPVIYLYPTQKIEVSVKLSLDGEFTCTYPEYNKGWDVTARTDGTLINHADNKEYSYLYWEGKSDKSYDMSKGFVVKSSETAEFLQSKLAFMGLTPKEYNEFIVYWLPILQKNKYNLIAFQGKAYTDTAKLDITPTPDSILRIFMTYKPLKKPVAIDKQELQSFKRKGFTVVEWGGGPVE